MGSRYTSPTSREAYHVDVYARRVVHVLLRNKDSSVSITLPMQRVTPVDMQEKLRSTWPRKKY